jgi:mannose-1-phosphate guanylyltransferase
MKFKERNSRDHRWALILAGGDGTRLLPLTRTIAGDDRPKQFCAVMGDETLLQQTRRRVQRLVPPSRTLLVLTKAHQPFFSDEVAGMPASRVLIQPSNKGTAPAILYSLLRLREMDPNGIVAFFPSAHHFSDDDAFSRYIDSAYAAAEGRPEMVVLLGIPPETRELEYGWIEPGTPLETDTVCRVRGFWEKPSGVLASSLMERGCLWNSFVLVGCVHAFLSLIRRALPTLVELFESIRSSLFTVAERSALCELYSGIGGTSFSREVLSAQPNGLAVLCATGLGWSDLGEPSRVYAILERKCVQTAQGFRTDYGEMGGRFAGMQRGSECTRFHRSRQNRAFLGGHGARCLNWPQFNFVKEVRNNV